MKLRTSFCNKTALKKDLTRFAPAWALYSVMLCMILFIIAVDRGDYSRTCTLRNSITFMAMVNLIYGFLNAQLLFGDLFNTRHCNALHAMPLRRECWYGTHLIAGLLFSLVPNSIFALAMIPLLGTGAQAVAYWLLAVMMQYLFFFGLAVFSALCVGNRFAMALVYGIINLFSMIAYLFIATLYEPMLEGVQISQTIFYRLCPIVFMMIDDAQLIHVSGIGGTDSYYYERAVDVLEMGEGWGYLAICTAIGVALLGVALALYRRRKLESAGDFMAVKVLEPVFLVLYTLSMAAFFQLFAELIEDLDYLFLSMGLAVGFFTGRMLLMRTTRVFQPKAFLWFVIFVAVFAGSLVLTALDPLGIESYVPAAEDVKYVKISTSYNPQYGEEPFLTDADDIDLVRQIHQLVVDGQTEADLGEENIYSTNLSFLYQMKNGTTVVRRYRVDCDSPAGALFASFLNRTEFVLGTDDPEELLKGLYYLYINYEPVDFSDQHIAFSGGWENPMERDPALVRGLVEAIYADCEAGYMTHSNAYRTDDAAYVGYIDFNVQNADDIFRGFNVTIYSDCINTVTYLTEHYLTLAEYLY